MTTFTQDDLDEFKETLEKSSREDILWAMFFGLGLSGGVIYFISNIWT